MSETNYHKYPWFQMLLYEYGLDPNDGTMYEWWELSDERIMIRFANLRTNTNISLVFDPNIYEICKP